MFGSGWRPEFKKSQAHGHNRNKVQGILIENLGNFLAKFTSTSA